MGNSDVSEPPTKARSFIASVLVLSLIANLISFPFPSDGRSFPATASRSFRFPSEHEEELWNTIPDTSSRNINSAQDSFTASVKDGKSSSRVLNVDREDSSDSEEESSAEVIEPPTSPGESYESIAISAPRESEANDNGKLSSTPEAPPEDEELRKILCPPTNSTESTSPTAADEDDEFAGGLSRIRYDLHMGMCSRIGEKGHCNGERMIFVADIESAAYGYCECDFEGKLQTTGMRKRSGEGTSLVFHPETNACYELYQKAYCKDGEWLVLSREKKGPICEPRKCNLAPPEKLKRKSGRRRSSKLLTPSLWSDNTGGGVGSKEMALQPSSVSVNSKDVTSEMGSTLFVPFNGTGPCVELNKENNEFCEEGEQILFNVGDIYPKCGIPGRQFEARAIVRNACPPGSFYSIIGRCQPDWDF